MGGITDRTGSAVGERRATGSDAEEERLWVRRRPGRPLGEVGCRRSQEVTPIGATALEKQE